ncbi:hypothetical protein [Desulfurivibrio alkaliphilus]|uniref:hypothetical protein n=1 Tax=Desulfurivibrio alkaliphilus TaxID=427923 RepID=UPI0001B406E6|nr:hypothetical protein [Desulfurivibrio alkaliphilus]
MIRHEAGENFQRAFRVDRFTVFAGLAAAGHMDVQEAAATSEAGRMPAENELKQ